MNLLTRTGTESTEADFNVYPVPARGVLHVQSKQRITITLLDQSGKRLLEKNIIGNSQLDIAHLMPAVYYIKNNMSGAIKKVVIVK